MKEIENEKKEMEEIKEEEENDKKNLSNDQALDIQINYLKSSSKNILYSLMANEPESDESKNKKIDKGIYLYLKYVYNKYYCNEIKYILGTINNKILYINDKNKKQKQNKDFYEREINTISTEKIEYFNKKETLDKELELLTINKMQNSYCQTEKSDPNSPNNTNINEIESPEINEKNKKIEELKKKYNKLLENFNTNKKEFPIIKRKNDEILENNKDLIQILTQKQTIWVQFRKENEKIKTAVIKGEDIKKEPEKKEEKKDEKNKNTKSNKMGSFLKNMFSKKK